jgi:hypothetical protein
VKALVLGGVCALTLTGEIPWQTDWKLASGEAGQAQKLILLVIDHPKAGC